MAPSSTTTTKVYEYRFSSEAKGFFVGKIFSLFNFFPDYFFSDFFGQLVPGTGYLQGEPGNQGVLHQTQEKILLNPTFMAYKKCNELSHVQDCPTLFPSAASRLFANTGVLNNTLMSCVYM